MVDIRTIRGKDKTDAFAKARVEYGGNFVILTSKDVKVGGFLGLGMKTEHELRIMLNNSIYDRKNNSEEKNSYDSSTEDDDMHRSKLLSDRIEMKKHTTETIDASEMADRIVAVTKALKEASRERNANRTSSSSAIKNSLNSSSQSVHSDSFDDDSRDGISSINEELVNETLESNNHSYIEEKNENISAREINNNSTDNFTPLPHFNNSPYSNFSSSTFTNVKGSILSDYNTNNSFSPINNYSNFANNSFMNGMNSNMNNFNSNVIPNHINTSNNHNNNSVNAANAIDENVKKLVQEQIRDMVKEYLEGSLPNINKNKYSSQNNSNSSNNKNAFTDTEDEEINNAIEEIKEYREENNLTREHKEKKTNIRDYFEDTDEISDDYNNNDESSDNSPADGMEESFNYLRDREFPEEVLLELREYLLTSSNARFFQSKDVIREEVEKYFSDKLILANGIDVGAKKKIIVFVGPTGVGKTTTIPKIAAQHMKSGKKVSFVTIDNYRIAAVDQLQRYASIMKVPFTSASTPEALRAEIRKMDNSSLLFIDTMGRSPKSAEEIVAMSKYFTTVGRFDMDIQLVMSATAKYKDAVKILNGFKPTNYKGVILTKVDETDYLASSICAITRKKLPITYITHGQGVPKDISTAKKYGYKIMEGLFGSSK
ncbi:flagellar biosynthesis regulator FlhF [Brachyspira murdochii]|uniref:Flagellar biosynthesis protein FlhF n=2 Tax=Brachyspira murdochii TaxID=84378 RepID=D5U4P2_BRAM5|nr:flagellar biosynthesis regulator FlhF [Brachyspira murdochii]ADG70287.1 GTP-binding signal recognition particle SRP54 G- domain protein [Brachyspira murdochii DSM 12563]PPS21536.1 flagellar biosynthesis regulator FlhF [Brachyspira murdochii]